MDIILWTIVGILLLGSGIIAFEDARRKRVQARRANAMRNHPAGRLYKKEGN